MDFKFRFVKNGQAANFLSKQGSVTSAGVVLDGEALPFERVADTTTRFNRLIINLSSPVEGKLSKGTVDPSYLVLDVHKRKAREVEREIDRHASTVQLEQVKQSLTAAGNAHLFRTSTCPECQATVNLSELAKTHYVFCRFCESVYADGHITRGQEYRHCDQCAMFDRVRPYTEFYFYFLLLVYGVSYKQKELCDNCAGSLFWKVLAINFIFVLGIVPALWMKIKSMSGRNPELAELAAANKLARSGRMREAAPLYAKLQERMGGHPGLLLNEALGHVRAQDGEGEAMLEAALRACSNYAPALRARGQG